MEDRSGALAEKGVVIARRGIGAPRRSAAACRAFSMAARSRRRTSETSTGQALLSTPETSIPSRSSARDQRVAVRRVGARGPDVDHTIANQRAKGIDHRLHSQAATAFNGNRRAATVAPSSTSLRTAGLLEENFARGDAAACNLGHEHLRDDRA